MFKRVFLSVLAILLLCHPCPGAEITVSAAASLADAFTEMKSAFEKEHPGVKINTNFAASNPLLRQIIAGSPADVFASADEFTMDQAGKAKVIKPETRSDFAANNLVLIVPADSPKPASLDDLLKMKRVAIGNPASVPAGRYAKASLEKAGLWNKLGDRLIRAESVRQALAYVARSEVDAGFVYGTDARQFKDKVDVALIVEDCEPVIYPIAACAASANPRETREFLDFVRSKRGQEILARYGFARP